MTVVWSPLMLISLKRLFFEAPTNDYHHLLFIECHGVNNCRGRVHLQEAVGKHTACALQGGATLCSGWSTGDPTTTYGHLTHDTNLLPIPHLYQG